MIYLRNNDKFAEVGLMESPLAKVVVRQPRDGTCLPREGVHGAYADVDAIVLAIYRYDGELHLFWNGRNIPWNTITGMSLARTADGMSLFVVSLGGEDLSLKYITRPRPFPEAIDAPFIEEEDWDFCLFLKHIHDSQYRSQAAFAPGARSKKENSTGGNGDGSECH